MTAITRTYTFTDGTTAFGSQVESEIANIVNTWNNHDAGTSSFTTPKVSADPTVALGIASKQYVDHYSTYRRPVLQYSSATVVNIETGINGTSGQAQILFPDGNLRTDSTSGRINCNLAQVAALSGVAQSGLRTGTVAVNTWYAIYAVKTSDNASNFVTVADTVLPLQANYATLNSNFGTSSWCYLGMIRNGDNSGSTNAIISFLQSGAITLFKNTLSVQLSGVGTLLVSAGATTSASYTYSAGTGTTGIPNHITHALYQGTTNTTPGTVSMADGGGARYYWRGTVAGAVKFNHRIWIIASEGVRTETSGVVDQDVSLAGFIDGVLGVGSNPLL